MPSEQIISFEKKVAKLLLSKLEHLQITADRAAEIAQYILATFPEDMSEQEFQIKFHNFENKFTELSPLFHEIVLNRDKEKTQQLITHIQTSLKDL